MKREEANTMWVFTVVNSVSLVVMCLILAGAFEPKPTPVYSHPLGLAERAHQEGYYKGLKENTDRAYKVGFVDGRMHELRKQMEAK